MTRSRPLAVAAALACALVLVACGSSDKKSTTAATTSAPAPAPAPSATSAPAIPFPSGAAPKRLVVRDLKRGTGPAARPGQTLTLNYVGAGLSDRRVFDSSYRTGQPFSFALGSGQVIPGWDRGLVGMRVGGRRLLVIPPGLGYGAQGSGPIKPNETLVFVVDLLGVQG